MNSEPDEPALFDLPLAPPGSPPIGPPDGTHVQDNDEPPARRSRARGSRMESLSLFGPDELTELEPSSPEGADAPVVSPRVPALACESLPRAERETAAERPRPTAVPSARSREAAAPVESVATAPLGLRLRAGLGDLVVLGAVGAGAALGARALGGSLAPRELPALLAFLLAFSFLYCVVSLAFWGQTPGMAWSGLVARTDGTEPLSFGQTAMRWLGHWLTWALAGLPALLAGFGGGGRSLADRLSGSSTYELPHHG